MIDESTKKMIDSMNYEHMLRLWRFASMGDPLFQGETGKYFAEVMKKRRSEISNSEQVRASKTIGWE
jgi:hypothetical protein